MNLEKLSEELIKIYEEFDTEISGYVENSTCEKGCSFCCSEVGNIDIVTLEGIIIRNHIESQPKLKRKKIKSNLKKNKSVKERKDIAACPFLDKKNSCQIYNIRPFSCRRLYSVKKCDENGPVVHKETMDLTKQYIKKIQELDLNGYSGHLSFILHLFNESKFRKFYLSGGFDPADIMDYGKSHKIGINKMINHEKKLTTIKKGTD